LTSPFIGPFTPEAPATPLAMRTEETRRILVQFFGHGLQHPEPNQYDIIISPSRRAKHEQTDLIIEEARGIREMVIVVNRSSGVDYEEKGEPARTATNVHEIGEFLEGALLELTDENTWACIKEIWFGEDRYETEVDVYDMSTTTPPVRRRFSIPRAAPR